MAIRIHVFGKSAAYIPKYDGNRDSKDPVVFLLRPMTAAEYRQHSTRNAAASSELAEDASATAETAFASIDQVVLDHVLDCGGLRMAAYDDNSELQHDSACTLQELVQYGPRALLLELYQAITDASVLAEGLQKKSS